MRLEVKKFAALMEAKLKKNDWKGGWKNETIADMIMRLNEEVAELNEIAFESSTGLDIRDECIDVANFAMMISDLIIDMGKPVKMTDNKSDKIKRIDGFGCKGCYSNRSHREGDFEVKYCHSSAETILDLSNNTISFAYDLISDNMIEKPWWCTFDERWKKKK